MNLEHNAAQEENYYNSESEGKDFKDYFYAPEEYGTWQIQTENNTQSDETFINTCEETYGKKNCHEETYSKNNTQEETYHQEETRPQT